jgi:hypothetical protein
LTNRLDGAFEQRLQMGSLGVDGMTLQVFSPTVISFGWGGQQQQQQHNNTG